PSTGCGRDVSCERDSGADTNEGRVRDVRTLLLRVHISFRPAQRCNPRAVHGVRFRKASRAIPGIFPADGKRKCGRGPAADCSISYVLRGVSLGCATSVFAGAGGAGADCWHTAVRLVFAPRLLYATKGFARRRNVARIFRDGSGGGVDCLARARVERLLRVLNLGAWMDGGRSNICRKATDGKIAAAVS